MKKILLAAAAFSTIALLLAPIQAMAGTVYIGSGVGTACATGNCPLYDGEVNATGTGDLDIYQSNLVATPATLVILLVGIPNVSTVGGAISNVQLFASPSGGGDGTPLSFSGPVDNGVFTGGDLQDWCNPDDGTCLAITGNQTFANWAAWDLAVLGITATEYETELFTIDTSFSGGDAIDVNFSGLPAGTFITMPYSEYIYAGVPTVTPFAQDGLVTSDTSSVPEPGSIALLSSALVGFGYMARRRQRA